MRKRTGNAFSKSDILKAMKKAVERLVRERKSNDVPLSVLKEGKIHTIPARKLNIRHLGL